MKHQSIRKITSIMMIFALLLSMVTPVTGNIAAASEVNSVTDAIENNSGEATVEGYIVGTVTNGPTYQHEEPFTVKTNLALADDPDETDEANIIPVQLPNNDIRSTWNLADHPEHLGEKVQITGSLEAYFGAPGLKSPTSFSSVSEEVFAEDVIISEYVEGSSFNKAIELYNGTGAEIDLSNYTVELYSNGNEDVQASANLSGTLEHGEAYVIYHNQADDAIKAAGDLENSGVINFNGDDAIVLKNNETIIDSVGQIPDRVNNLKDVTLVRNSTIVSGDTDPYDAFDPSLEWTSYPKDTFEYLGSHTMDGVNPDEPGEPDEPVEPTEPISIADARSQGTGIVTVQGVVTAKLKNTIHFQDKTAALAIYPNALDVHIGDEITVTGTLSEFNGLLQLQDVTLIDTIERVGAPEPAVITGAELNEENESKLATIKDVTLESVDEGNGWANYTATDGTTFIVRDETGTLELSAGTAYDSITGIVQQYGENYQIIPRNRGDIVADASAVQAVEASHYSGTIVSGTEVSLSTRTEDATIYYTTNGEEPTEESNVYEEPIIIDENMTIKAFAVKDGLTPSNVMTFTYTVFDQETGMQIHHLQGEAHESPLNGTFVTGIEGVVTYIYEIGNNNYFHFQTPDELQDDNPKTSEGIVVFTGNRAANVEIGDLVSVDGTVDEYHIDGYWDTKSETDLPVTQINARDDRGGVIEVVETDVELPTPVVIDENNLPSEVIDNDSFTEFDPEEDAIDFWESLEGMLVEMDTVKAVAPQEHGDLVTVLEDRETDTLHGGVMLTEENANPDRIHFKLYDNNEARDFEVATGDKFEGPITGVVNYGFQNYKVYTDLEDMQEKHVEGDAEPEETTIEKADDELTIASYNLENFSNNKASTSDDKARRLARAFATDMQSPDIIGVTEIQDNNGAEPGSSAADESYERLIQAIVDAGGVEYEYVNIDPLNNEDGGQPNANIRVGFLYNPDRVTLTEGMPAGDATTAVGYEDGKLTHNPGRIDPLNDAFNSSRKPLAAQFDFQGEEVVVIVNHWNSKSGDTPLFGSTQPPVYGSEAQRTQIAEVVYDFVEDIKADDPDANVVSVGDFNDFQWTEALEIHEGELMTNMIHHVEDEDRYTYLYQGNSQVLDHILVSNHLVDSTEVDILHINADFTDMAGRASDHDPVMVQIDLQDEADGSELDEAIANAQTAVDFFDRPDYLWSADEERLTKLEEAREAVEAVLALDSAYDVTEWNQLLDDAEDIIEKTIALEEEAEVVNERLRNLSYDDPSGEYILTDEDYDAAVEEYNEVKAMYDDLMDRGAKLDMFDTDGLNGLDYQKRKIDQYPIHKERLRTAVEAVEQADFSELEVDEDTAEAKLETVQGAADEAIDTVIEDRMERNTVVTEVSYNEETGQYEVEVKIRDWGLSEKVNVEVTFASEQEEIVPEKSYSYHNLKRGKLVVNDKSVSLTLTGNRTNVRNGVDFRGTYGTFYGEGFENLTVTINPKTGEGIYDFNGIHVEKVVINDKFRGEVVEIRGAENIESIEAGKGIDLDDIRITDSDGEAIVLDTDSKPERNNWWEHAWSPFPWLNF